MQLALCRSEWRSTGLQVGEWDLPGEQLPQTQGIAEHVGLDGVARALGEHLGGHPT